MGLVDSIGSTLGDLGTIQANAVQNQGLISAQTAQTQGNIAAQRVSTLGQIHAQQVQANAALWMNFANNVANMAANVPVQMAAEKKAKQDSTLAAMQIDVAKQTLADKAAARAETQAIRDQIVKDGGDIIDKNILQVAPIIGADFLKTRAETATAGANAVQAKAKAESAQLQQLTQELPGVIDEPTKMDFAAKVSALNPKIGEYIQKQPYSKELVEQLQTIGMDAAAKADFNVKALDKLIKQQSADKGGIELATAGNEWLGSTLAAHPVEQWDDFLKQAAVMKVPAAVIASYREIMNDENAQAKAGQMSMTEKERDTVNKPPAPGAPVKVIGPDGKPVYTTAKDAIGKTPVPEGGAGGGPLVAVIGPDGRPVLVPRAEAAGMTPASSQPAGRPVTSADAGRVAELQSSLDQLDSLRGAVPPGTTGVQAQAGALVPNFITQWTGVGADAKSKQAVIDQVKQVIGKALEGGVLRKEDEAKYEKILPTIGDVDTVVKAKLDNLDKAIQNKRTNLIEALQDAGYDVSKIQARTPAGAGGATPGGKVTVTSPSGRSYPFDSQAQADAFVRDAKAKGLWK